MRTLHDIYDQCNMAIVDPTSYAKARNSACWKVAMDKEMNMIIKNGMSSLVQRIDTMHVISAKWIFRTKFNSNGFVNKYKARLVVKGHSQLPEVDFSDTFTPIAKFEIIRLLITLAASLGWPILHLDIISAFLNGFLQEDIYLDQPEGYDVKSKHNMVYKIHKALYGLKQALRA